MLLSNSRQSRISEHQAQARADHVSAMREAFARQVPGEYRAHGIDALSGGTRDWSGALTRDGSVALARYMRTPTRYLILHGPTGTGKSTAAYALADHVVASTGRSARFASFSAMLSEFSFGSGESSASKALADYSSAPILVIDDIGSINDGMTDHQRRSLWSLVNDRWSNRLLTIITTNMAVRSNRDGVGLSDFFGDSAWDRITDDCVQVEFDRASFRTGRSPEVPVPPTLDARRGRRSWSE